MPLDKLSTRVERFPLRSLVQLGAEVGYQNARAMNRVTYGRCARARGFPPVHPTSAAAIGNPSSIPSSTTIPNGSYQLGTTSTSASRYQCANASGESQPVKCTRSP
jgi:hypothetical protein